MKKNLLIYLSVFFIWSCSVESQKGQAVGFVTHFTRSGVIWKSWDMELNSSQTGMTSTAREMDLSIDNDNEDSNLVSMLDSAQKFGWKVQVDYQQNFGANCMDNRGGSSRFIQKIEVLDKTPLGGIRGGMQDYNPPPQQRPVVRITTPPAGRVIDTIYVVVDKSKIK